STHAILAPGPSWGLSGNCDVVWSYPGVRVVRYSLRQLQRHLWFAGSGNCPTGLALSGLNRHLDWSRVQCTYLPQTRDGVGTAVALAATRGCQRASGLNAEC